MTRLIGILTTIACVYFVTAQRYDPYRIYRNPKFGWLEEPEDPLKANKLLTTISNKFVDHLDWLTPGPPEGRRLYISNTNLHGMSIQGATARSGILDRVDFKLSGLTSVDFWGAGLTNVGFWGAGLTNVGFWEAGLINVDFIGAGLTNVDFWGAGLNNVRFWNAGLNNVRFREAGLTNVRFREAGLTNVRFIEAGLTNVDFWGAGLTNVRFWGAGLTKVDFWGAGLTNVRFIEAGLTYVGFTEAGLTNVCFIEAGLTNVRFQQSTLENFSLRNTTLKETVLPTRNTNLLTEHFFGGANLVNLSLNGFNLSDTDFTGMSLNGVTLGKAYVGRAVWEIELGEFPKIPSLATAGGLKDMTYRNSEAALVELRSELGKVGMRKQQREVHYAIQERKREIALDNKEYLEAFFRWILRETSGYGLYGWRPLKLMAYLAFAMAPVYLRIIGHTAGNRKPWGIFIVPNEQRVNLPTEEAARPILDECSWAYCHLTPIHEQLWQGIKDLFWAGFHALYFSAVTTFHIGFRELNIGTWLINLDPRQIALRSTGWVRIVAGVQRIVGVLLFGIFVFSYFKLPLE